MDWSFLFDGLGTTCIGALLKRFGIGSGSPKNTSSASTTAINPQMSAGDGSILMQTVITKAPAAPDSPKPSFEDPQQDAGNVIPNQHAFVSINTVSHPSAGSADAHPSTTAEKPVTVYNIGKIEGLSGEHLKAISQIYDKSMASVLKAANDIAIARIDDLKQLTLPRIEKMEHALEDLKNPASQRFLLEAQQEAMVTDSPDAMKLLSDLIVEHINNYSHKDKQVTIRHAVKVISEIDPEALRAMTLFHLLRSVVPTRGNVIEGLQIINKLIHPLLSSPLPTGSHWTEHLSLLNAIRIVPTVRISRLDDYYAQLADGYTCIGIKENSPQHIQAKELLQKANLRTDILVPNDLLPGYVRIPVPSKTFISQWVLTNGKDKHPITPEEKQTFFSIFDLYEQNSELQLQVIKTFKSRFSQFESLATASEWWNHIPVYFELTLVGTVLAVLNGRRYNSDISFPD